jgi:hypothetical protein
MKIFTTLCGVALLIGGAIYGQSPDRMTVKFPAPVMINGATLPAGDATIQVLHTSGNLILSFHSDSGETANVLVNRLTDTASEDQPRVILDHTGNTYRLNRILLTDHTALQVLDAQ